MVADKASAAEACGMRALGDRFTVRLPLEGRASTDSYRLRLDQSLITTLEGQICWAQRQDMVSGPTSNLLPYVRTDALRRIRPDGVSIAKPVGQ